MSLINILILISGVSFLIYGISSLVPGDIFRVDYLPERHRKLVFFQIVLLTLFLDIFLKLGAKDIFRAKDIFLAKDVFCDKDVFRDKDVFSDKDVCSSKNVFSSKSNFSEKNVF